MNFLKTLAASLVIVGIISSALVYPMAPAESPTQIRSPLTTADHVIGEAQRQLDQISIIFITLSGIMSTAHVSLENKQEVLQQLRKMAQFITTLRNRKFADADIPLAYEFLHINNVIMEYALDGLNKGFCNTGDANLETMVKNKPTPAHVDMKQTAQLLMHNQHMLAELTYRVDNYGLSWSNRAYRVLDDYIISPCKRHSIPFRLFGAVTITSLGLYLWWRLGNESFGNNAPSPIRKLFGDDVPREPGMNQDSNVDTLRTQIAAQENRIALLEAFAAYAIRANNRREAHA